MAAYTDAVLADAPLAYWMLEEASGTTLVDSSGNTRNGTWTGTPGFGAAGMVLDEGTSTAFSGDDKATVTAAAWFPKSAYTYEMVVSYDAWGAGKDWYNLFCQSGVFDCYINRGDLTVQIATGNNWNAFGGSLPAGTEAHLAFTFDGSALRVYIDGTQVVSAPHAAALPASSNPYEIGGGGTYPAGTFEGRLQKVAVYGTALSAARIAAHAGALTGGPPPAPTPSTTPNTFNRANGRTRTGLAEAWVEYDLDDITTPEPLRIMAQQMPTPNLVNGRPT